MRFGVTFDGGADSEDGRQNTFLSSVAEFWASLELPVEPWSEK